MKKKKKKKDYHVPGDFKRVKCTRLCNFNWFPHSRSLNLKALILSYLSVTSLSLPCSSLLRLFKSPGTSAKTLDWFSVHRSILQYMCPSLPWIISSHSINKTKCFTTDPRLNYLTLAWWIISSNWHSTSFNNATSSRWFRVLAGIKFAIFIAVTINWFIYKIFAHNASSWRIEWTLRK